MIRYPWLVVLCHISLNYEKYNQFQANYSARVEYMMNHCTLLTHTAVVIDYIM